MRVIKYCRPVLLAAAIGTITALALPSSAYAEGREGSLQAAAEAYRTLTANGAKPGADNTLVHILPTQSARANVPHSILARTNFYGFDLSKATVAPGSTAPAASASSFPSPSLWNPDDLVNHGGYCSPIYFVCSEFGVTSATIVDIFVNCNGDTCWGDGKAGNVFAFQDDLSASKFIHITDQYVGDTANGRYPVDGTWGWYTGVTGPVPSGFTNQVLTDANIQALVDGMALNYFGYGYNFIYHVFLPNKMDVCFDTTYSFCYSPDKTAVFTFCGYHGSFDGSAGHALYTVEPYDYVPDCYLSGMSASDAQFSILAHETFETITDPDPDNQWFEPSGSSYGEIGDYCAWHIFDIPLVTGYRYNGQLMYDNHKHACAASY